MVILEELMDRKTQLSVIGLGYVGLPIAVAFSQHVRVIGYDCNPEKIAAYEQGKDATGEVGESVLKNCAVQFTAESARLEDARFHIVAVPTPVNPDKTPNFSPLISASTDLGRNLTKGSIVVYESTVYPGVTEDICVPILERESGLKCGRDFKVGYSPERINPGDKEHRLQTIRKIVSGMDSETLDTIARVYELVVEAGTYRASSIRVAEAAKVIENSQRDLNIAFMNELSLIFHRLGIDTLEVLQAAETKWNFIRFRPGLVGGHCIGVDPYYLTYCAEQLGYNPQVILAGRRINDSMGGVVAQNVVKMLGRSKIDISSARVAILGFTFKENCPDTRNTKVIDIYNELMEYGIVPMIFDPVADLEEMCLHYGLPVVSEDDLAELDAVIIAVAHKAFYSMDIVGLLKTNGILFDIKGMMQPPAEHPYWRL
ncbi:MAG: nucleotide sugar dehydrogenase [Bacillota bacterium]